MANRVDVRLGYNVFDSVCTDNIILQSDNPTTVQHHLDRLPFEISRCGMWFAIMCSVHLQKLADDYVCIDALFSSVRLGGSFAAGDDKEETMKGLATSVTPM